MAEEYDIVSDLNGDDTSPTEVVTYDNPNEGTPPAEPQKDTPEPAKRDAKAPKELSLRDQISSALKGEDETPGAAQQDGGRRDPATGRFLPKDATPVGDGTQGEMGMSAGVVARPPNLEIADEVFASLPPETQQYLAQTAEYVEHQMQRWQSYDTIEQLIGPRRNAWAMAGMTEAQAVHQLFALSDFATTDPAAFVKYFAQNNNVDLEQLAFGDGDDDEYVDPQVAALQRTVHDLTQRLDSQTHAEQQRAHENTVNYVLQFMDERGADNTPLRPYVNELGNDFLVNVRAVKESMPTANMQTILQEAYERSCWANPSVRAKMQKSQEALSEAERLRKASTRTAEARNAGVSVASGVPSAPGSAPTNRSLRDELRAAFVQHT